MGVTYAMVMVVRPLVTISKASWISRSVFESRDAVASSKRRMRLFLRMARAIATYQGSMSAISRVRSRCLLHVDARHQRALSPFRRLSYYTVLGMRGYAHGCWRLCKR